MNNVEQETNFAAIEKYKSLISMISRTEDRLRLLDFAYIFLNVVVLLFSIMNVSHLVQKVNYILTYMDYALIYLILIVGMSINIYWVAFVMRIQLKLKLRYFQARSIERRLDSQNEKIFSDEDIFFDPDIRRIESSDGKEACKYPTTGLTRMDGLVGSLKPRHFSWLLPCMFITIYWLIFILLVTTI